MQKNNKNSRKNGNQRRRPLLVEDDIDPPRWLSCSPIHRVMRLGVTAAKTEFDFTVLMLCRFQSMVVVSSTTAYSLASAVRVKWVKMWGVTSAIQTSASVALEWSAGSTGFLLNDTSVSDTTVSTTRAAYIKCKPPRQSLASWYQSYVQGGTNNLFTITCPAGAVIDIAYDWVLNSTEPANVTFTPTALAAGTVFAQNPDTNIVVLTPLNAA
jgi:hypothetical protein